MNKSFLMGEVKAVDSDAPNGEFEVILSAPTLDRDGEVIDAGAFAPLPEHITFDVDHGMSVTTTVGSGVPTYDGDLLKVRGSYASTPLAQQTRALVNEGHIRSTSVAFMEARREVKDGVPHIVKAELLNGAFVAIPSNRQAAVLASKSARRDLSVVARKSIAGSFEALRDDLQVALRDAHPDAWWVYVLATFDASVVYEVDGRDGVARFQADYSIADDGALSVAAGVPVEVVEIIEPAKAATSNLLARVKSAGEVQQLHDLTAAHGATCAPDGEPVGKTPDPAAAPAAAAPASPAALRVLAAQAEAVLALA